MRTVTITTTPEVALVLAFFSYDMANQINNALAMGGLNPVVDVPGFKEPLTVTDLADAARTIDLLREIYNQVMDPAIVEDVIRRSL